MPTTPTFEFDLVVKVRKRLWLSGPKTAADAKAILQQALEGGLSPATFAKIGADGKPMEFVEGNDFEIREVPAT